MTVTGSTSGEMRPESVILHPLGTAAAPEPDLLCIFGTGDLGRSLGLRLLQSGYRVVYGSRRPHSCGPLPQGAQVPNTARHWTWGFVVGDRMCKKICVCAAQTCSCVLNVCVCAGDEPRSSSSLRQPHLYLCSQRTLWLPRENDTASPRKGEAKVDVVLHKNPG